MKVANDVIKFIQAQKLNHRQFQNFPKTKCEVDYGDVIYCCDVRWLSRAKLLKRIAALKRCNQRIHHHEKLTNFRIL